MAEPIKSFKVGACKASIFVNKVNTAKGIVSMKNVNLQKTYKDKEGNFQHVTSFGINDIPKAQLALSKAYEYLAMENRAE